MAMWITWDYCGSNAASSCILTASFTHGFWVGPKNIPSSQGSLLVVLQRAPLNSKASDLFVCFWLPLDSKQASHGDSWQQARPVDFYSNILFSKTCCISANDCFNFQIVKNVCASNCCQWAKSCVKPVACLFLSLEYLIFLWKWLHVFQEVGQSYNPCRVVYKPCLHLRESREPPNSSDSNVLCVLKKVLQN